MVGYGSDVFIIIDTIGGDNILGKLQEGGQVTIDPEITDMKFYGLCVEVGSLKCWLHVMYINKGLR